MARARCCVTTIPLAIRFETTKSSIQRSMAAGMPILAMPGRCVGMCTTRWVVCSTSASWDRVICTLRLPCWVESTRRFDRRCILTIERWRSNGGHSWQSLLVTVVMLGMCRWVYAIFGMAIEIEDTMWIDGKCWSLVDIEWNSYIRCCLCRVGAFLRSISSRRWLIWPKRMQVDCFVWWTMDMMTDQT